MKINSAAICTTVILLVLFSVSSSHAQKSNPLYNDEMNEWYQRRIHALKAPNGWLNLAGLFWLKEGNNSFGSDTSNDVSYNSSSLPPKAGNFILNKGIVKWKGYKGFKVRINNELKSNAILFKDDSHNSPVVSLGSLRWSIIKRDSLYGVRLRDLEHPALTQFKELNYFPIDTTWRIQARFEAKEKDSVRITNMIGQTSNLKSPGRLHFTITGVAYSLDALENTDDDLFIIFGDVTNGIDTYASGRYIYIPKADNTGNVVIDFNKSINPPCVFTTFATCPMPPRQNQLPLRVEAGEKMYKME